MKNKTMVFDGIGLVFIEKIVSVIMYMELVYKFFWYDFYLFINWMSFKLYVAINLLMIPLKFIIFINYLIYKKNKKNNTQKCFYFDFIFIIHRIKYKPTSNLLSICHIWLLLPDILYFLRDFNKKQTYNWIFVDVWTSNFNVYLVFVLCLTSNDLGFLG